MSRRNGAPPTTGKDTSTPVKEDPTQDKQARLLSQDSGHFSLIRALHLADFITLLNGFSGIMSVFSSLRYCLESTHPSAVPSHTNLYAALVFIPLGLFFDFMDGKVARWRRKASLMGQELDSLADLVSFGVAPASAAFALGLRTPVDHVLLSVFVLCGLTRLARFNVTVAMLPKDESGKSKFFEGTPIPTSLMESFLMMWWVRQGWMGENLPLGTMAKGSALEFHPIALLFVAHGCFMVSKTLRVPKP